MIILLIGDDPIQTYGLLIGSAFSWPDGIGYTLFYATPLIFTGSGGGRGAPLLNIGADAAAFACAWAAITFASFPSWALIAAMMVAAIAAGAVGEVSPAFSKRDSAPTKSSTPS